MPSRREQISMTEDEAHAFLLEERTVIVATTGPSGRPHMMPLWYVADGLELRGWTFAKSQKARNLERDPRATLQVEAGVEYHLLRGLMIEADVEIETDPDRVAGYGEAVFRRYASGGAALPPETTEMIAAQAPKRVGLRFSPTRVVSWDHRKLGGIY